MQQSDYEIVGKFGFESRTHRKKIKNIRLWIPKLLQLRDFIL